MFSLKKVKAKGFKCFSSIEIELPEITILTGANSSGKTSFLDAILAPFQTSDFPYYLSPNGKYVDMGDFIEMSFCRNRDGRIELTYVLESGTIGKATFDTAWIRDKRSSIPQLVEVNIMADYAKANAILKRGSNNYLLNLSYEPESFKKIADYEQYSKFQALLLGLFKSLDSNKTQKMELSDISAPINIHDEKVQGLNEVKLRMFSNFAIANMVNAFSLMEKEINYISSFRLPPERTYYQHTKAEKVGRSGDNYIDQIIEWERQKSPKFLKLRTGLTELGLLTGIHTRPRSGGRYEISIKSGKGGVWSALTDVGFGISQFLPIIVADLQLSSGSTLILAQPEIHLHPSAQASLGNYFANRIKADKKRYIIETHSEYLLNRVRLLIAEGTLSPSNVAVYHFERHGCETKVHQVYFQKNGKIEGAPQDFFNTYMLDVLDIAMKAS